MCRGVMAFRKWLATAAGGGPQYAGADAPEAWRNGLGQLRRRELLDRYSQHTQNCASCRKVASPQLLQPAVFSPRPMICLVAVVR